MVFNLSKLLRKLYDAIGHSRYSVATGGSATTVIDTRLKFNEVKENAFDGAALFIVSADGESPEDKFEEISSYDNQTGTFTLLNSLTDVVAADDRYGVMHAYFPIHTMIEIINAGLQNLDMLHLVDITTLTALASTTEYAAPVLWKKGPVTRIDIARTDDSANYNWANISEAAWEFIPSTAGAVASIEFRNQLAVGQKLRIWYLDTHPRVEAYNDPIYEGIAPALAQAAVVYEALRWQLNKQGDGDANLDRQYIDAGKDLTKQKILHPIPLPEVKAGLMQIAKR